MGWRRGQLIGKGAFGEVHLAIPSNPAFPMMAVKSALEEDAASLVLERQILENFHDVAGVIQCFGGEIRQSGISGGKTYNLLMEFASKGCLVNLIAEYAETRQRAGIPESHVKSYARMILRGLSAIHSKGYTHCDIKPGNVLVFPPSARNRGLGKGLCELKIGDFGLAMETPTILKPGSKSFKGTVRYMPREVVVEGKVSPAMDVWALGCTVIEMLTGNFPWSNCKEDRQVYMEIAKGRSPEIPEWLSEQGKEFLRMCFVSNPTYRRNVDRFLKHPFVADFGVIGDRRTTKTAASVVVEANAGAAGLEKQRSPGGVYPLHPHQFFQQGRAAALMC